MFAYITAYFICFWRIRFFFLSAFNAYCFPDSICLARNTFPNCPLPSILTILKDEKLTFPFPGLAFELGFPFYLCTDLLSYILLL
jgi:hypothetical protein